MTSICQRDIFGKFAGILLITWMSILCGCTSLAIPRDIPPVFGVGNVSLSGVSVELINIETDTNESPIYETDAHDGRKSMFIANRNLWTEKLVTALSRELKSRGATIASGAKVKISLALPEIKVYQSFGMRFHVKVNASSNSNWTKTYTGTGASTTAGWGFVDAAAARGTTETLQDVVKAMLTDSEFIAQLKR